MAFALNGTSLCPWNYTFSEEHVPTHDDLRGLDGNMYRDVAARRYVFELEWEYLPESFDGTYHAYQDLRNLGTMSGTMNFTRPIGTSSSDTTFRVFADPPDSEMMHRAQGSNIYWNVSMTLRES